MGTSMRGSCRIRKGFSLAEAVMATAVLGIAAAGVLLPFTSGATVRAEGMHRTLAAKLASDLIEQIINTPFTEIQTSYDEPQGQIRDAAGNLLKDTDPSYANFSRTAICELWHGSDYFILVTVKVYYSGKQIAIINRLISK
jgi:prepilin-type N-terminal cleavage/methylation domain-containing protein